MKSKTTSRWSYFVEGQNNTKFNIITSPYGQICDVLEMEFEVLTSTDLNIEAWNRLDRTISQCVTTEVQSRTVFLKIDTRQLSSEIQVFEIKFLNPSSNSVGTIDIALTPLPKHLPEVIFVIGSPRSGTTVVGKLAQLGFDTKTHGESHVVDVFLQMSKISDLHFNSSPASKNNGTLTNELPSAYVYCQLLMNLRELYLRVYSGGPIIDKTPGIKMIESLPLLLRAFPNAKIIYCRRRGLENIASRMRKFKKVPFEGHCKQWVRSIKLWIHHKKSLLNSDNFSSQFFEVEQLELAKNPEKVVSELIEFLLLPKGKKHKLLNYLERHSPQKTGNSPNDIFDLDVIDWSDEQKKTFISVCGETMKDQNYSLNEKYFLK